MTLNQWKGAFNWIGIVPISVLPQLPSCPETVNMLNRFATHLLKFVKLVPRNVNNTRWTIAKNAQRPVEDVHKSAGEWHNKN